MYLRSLRILSGNPVIFRLSLHDRNADNPVNEGIA